MKKLQTAFLAAFLLIITTNAEAQTLAKNNSGAMEIPSVITLSSSPAHLYVLSDKEGLAVFRTYSDSLQWLYTSPNMQRRGDNITADVRFAYLFGASNRLTVLEPTSVMGVYSATYLPARPLDAERIEQDLFVALGNNGLGKISLRTPAAVDSTFEVAGQKALGDRNIIDLESSSKQLFVLSDGADLFVFRHQNEKLSLVREIELSEEIDGIYLLNSSLYATDADGNIYEMSNSGSLSKLRSIDERITKIEKWKDQLIIRGESNRVWVSGAEGDVQLWKEDQNAGNYFTVSEEGFWLSEYNIINNIIERSQQLTTVEPSQSQQYITESFSIKPVPDQTITHSKPLLFPIGVSGAEDVQFSYQSTNIENAEIRGQSFYWRPSYDDIGTHHVKIIGINSSGEMDSTNVRIKVNSFNAPPRFAPIRPINVPVGEEFMLPIKATDPDGMNQNLIRFLGVNLPYGASIDETTGTFTWTPTMRQMGENTFRVIATDQYGAAASVDVTINVIENLRQ